MQIEIITPDSTIFSGEIILAQFPGKDGSFEILNNHAPIISVLKKGKIKIQDKEKQTHFFEITGGVVEIKKNKIIVLAE
jgi:F-type H+-transporting ATPase subunit epsilon